LTKHFAATLAVAVSHKDTHLPIVLGGMADYLRDHRIEVFQQ
jgi:hypothetical protein